ncbi:MAG: 2-amino-4-hydroxy-6-hydroxymethyldihydropteridine diphosphokinase [Rhodospirillaceae bacterium]|nr:2-amino-4-hydroxy-6-hydroxymethyldihydropteridine diphosphokinase [Rhodospirillaceae bacterium]
MTAGRDRPILIGLGANLPSRFGPPRATCEAAVAALEAEGLRVVRRSRWYESAPVPASDQPWYVNGVVEVETALTPEALLALLHRVEACFGRERRERNEPRVIDLDLLAYGSRVNDGPAPPLLPHPRAVERGFVLLPLRDVAPDWVDPRSGRPLDALIAALPARQITRPLDGEARMG